jgi:hypothetical protein
MALLNEIVGVIAIIIMLLIASASDDKEGLVKGINKTIKTVTDVIGKIVSRVNRI